MTIAPPDQQLRLLEVAPSWKITKNAQARNAYGSMAQELVCATLGLTPVPINGNYDCCFDAIKGGTHYEIKNVRQGGKIPLYKWRLEKEARAGVNLCYAILLHRVRKSDGRELLQDFIAGGLQVVVVSAPVVHELAMECSLRRITQDRINPRHGYNRIGYRDGYFNLPVRALFEFCPEVSKRRVAYAGVEFSVTVMGEAPPAPSNPF